jgi:GH15 family glucan-1,4-alpha-glucosidase
VRSDRRVDGYLPIAGYGLIGDCRSAALVGEDGSVDWLCLPRFDDASVFGRILDADRGGHWSIGPGHAQAVTQRYRDLSNVLVTIWETTTGRVVVTDFMPVAEATIENEALAEQGIRLVRLVECLGGDAVVRSDVRPAPDYGRVRSDVFVREAGKLHADAAGLHLCVRGSIPLTGPTCHCTLTSGGAIAFALVTGREGHCPGWDVTVEMARRLLRETQEFWWRWALRLRYDGPYTAPVRRSAIALKAMTYAPTGAIVAAPTTSLPEGLGGVRNWDYRFTWLRDASFTLYAFFQLGMTDEAEAFFRWLSDAGVGAAGQPVDNLYTIDGKRLAEEEELRHLEGYRRSRPVRIGNGAAQQLQLDVYGEVMDSAYLYARFGGEIRRSLWRELRNIVELAIVRWEEPDSSIWEVRGGQQHYTYSKLMCWVAVDRGLRLAERFSLPHDPARWQSARRAIHRRIIKQAWSPKLGAFTQSFGSQTLDAAMLRMAQVRFLPDRDRRLRSTTDTIGAMLGDGELVRRYRVDETDDGLSGDEGAFLMCSFWLADAYSHFGEVERAQRLFEELLCFASPLGLFAEEADSRTGALLGNYPQAFTHLALIGAAVNIERARHRAIGVHGLAPRRSRVTT